MKVQRRYMAGTMLVALVGMGVALTVHFALARPAYADTDAKQKVPEEALRVANELSEAFSYSADEIRPSVVRIEAVKHVRPARYGRLSPLPRQGDQNGFPFGEDFLRRFFNGQLQPPEFDQQGLGSGVIISSDGYILTNNHVVGDADQIMVKLTDGREFTAKVVGRDPQTDLAVIQIKADRLRPAELGDSNRLKVGEWVVAAGNPFGLSDTITAGIVSAKGRANVHIAQYEDFIQTDAPINPGNSGGPLIDLHGRVVGITTAIASRNGGNMGVGFAIPIDMAKTVMKSLIHSGHVTRGWLGIGIQPLTEDLSKSFKYENTQGVLVSDVQSDSPAGRAGLQPGYILTGYNGTKISDLNQFRNEVAATKPGESVRLEIYRDAKPETLTVKVGEMKNETGLTEPEGASPELGMSLENLTPESARELGGNLHEGVLVTSVEPGGLAAMAGIQPNDIILSVQDTPVKDAAALEAQLSKHNLKDGIRMVVQSGEMKRFVFLRVAE